MGAGSGCSGQKKGAVSTQEDTSKKTEGTVEGDGKAPLTPEEEDAMKKASPPAGSSSCSGHK